MGAWELGGNSVIFIQQTKFCIAKGFIVLIISSGNSKSGSILHECRLECERAADRVISGDGIHEIRNRGKNFFYISKS